MDIQLNLKSPWPAVREKLKENDISLSDEDLQFEPGQENQLLERLSRKMNKSLEETKSYIESISANTAKSG